MHQSVFTTLMYKLYLQAAHLLDKLARTSTGLLSPLAASLGGVVAQECLKAITHKHMPIRQLYYPDCSELMDDTPDPLDFTEAAPSEQSLNRRCLGTTVLAKLASQRYGASITWSKMYSPPTRLHQLLFFFS
jgi:hypothetical protein